MCLKLFYCSGTVKEFARCLNEDADISQEISQLRHRVELFAAQFPMPGFDDK